jgi:hypothetical protein
LLVFGAHQLRVKPMGAVAVQGLLIANSITSSAIFSEGELRVTRCTFRDCAVVENEDMRHVELVLRGLIGSPDDAAYPSTAPSARGGAIFLAGTRPKTSECTLEATTFVRCSATGAAAFGGAVFAAGGSVLTRGSTSFFNNSVYVTALPRATPGEATSAGGGHLPRFSSKVH